MVASSRQPWPWGVRVATFGSSPAPTSVHQPTTREVANKKPEPSKWYDATVYESFLAALPRASAWPPEAHEALRQDVRALLERGAEAHPGVRGDPGLFAERLGQELAGQEQSSWQDARAQLGEFDVEGVYLAAACAAGEAAAITRFEALYFQKLPSTLRSMGAQPADIDDVTSAVREKLFVAKEGERPGVLGFSGRGSLEKLCRVIAARTLLNRQRSTRRERVSGDQDLASLIAPQVDPEVAALKQHHRDVFRAALGKAVEKLSSEDRNLLRLSLIHRLSIDEVGGIYRIHRSTAARRLGRLKDAIAQDTRMALRLELGVDRKELQSLFRLVQTGLDKSFMRLLGASATHGQ